MINEITEIIKTNNRLNINSIASVGSFKEIELYKRIEKEAQEGSLLIIGPRQVGKTSSLKMLVLNREDNDGAMSGSDSRFKDILFLNTDQIAMGSVINSIDFQITLIDYVKNNGIKLLIIDEIQKMKKWPEFLKSTIDVLPEVKVIATGSNAYALSQGSEIGTGRFSVLWANHLLLDDFLKLAGVVYKDMDRELLNDEILDSLLHTYLTLGAFPDSIKSWQKARDLTSDRTFEIIASDLNVKKSKIEGLLRMLYLKGSIEFNSSNVANTINSESNANPVNRQLVTDLIEMLHYSNVITKVHREKFKGQPKIYVNNFISIPMAYATKFNKLDKSIQGIIVEQAVFNYLSMKFNNTKQKDGVLYFKNLNKKEIDFIINNKEISIEVKYSKNPSINDQLSKRNGRKIVITDNVNKKVGDIEYISLFKFLLGEW